MVTKKARLLLVYSKIRLIMSVKQTDVLDLYPVHIVRLTPLGTWTVVLLTFPVERFTYITEVYTYDLNRLIGSN